MRKTQTQGKGRFVKHLKVKLTNMKVNTKQKKTIAWKRNIEKVFRN